MDYRLKLLFTWGLELLPFTDSLYYFIQKNITKRFDIDEKLISHWHELSKHHLKAFYKFNNEAPENLLDFGCGWILGYPLLMTKYCKNVVACDIKPLARKELNLDVENKLKINFKKIKYITPCDISNTNFDNESFDLITSNSVLEHIPKAKMNKVASECYRLLTKNGVCSFHIGHQDHWSHSDSKLAPMNYLKYSEKNWKFLNPPLNYQNRLLQSDYISIFTKVGFNYEVTSSKYPCNVEINEEFDRYNKNDFHITHSDFIFYK